MATDHIWFRALDLDRLLFRPFAALDPLERLRRCHVEVCVIEIALLLCCDVTRIEVAGTVALAVLLHSPEDALRCRETVLRLIDFTSGIDLLGPDALCNRAGRRNRILATQCNEAVLERRHLCASTDAHRIACPRVERRIPHLVARKTWIIGAVKSCSSARRDEHRSRLYVVSGQIANRKAPGTVHRAVRDLEICDIDVIEHGDVALLEHALGQERLDILAVDLDVAPPARDIIPAFILQDHEPASLEVFRDLVDRLCDCHHEIIADDALRILACILDVVGRRVAVRNVGIERIDTRGQAAAAFDIRFLRR